MQTSTYFPEVYKSVLLDKGISYKRPIRQTFDDHLSIKCSQSTPILKKCKNDSIKWRWLEHHGPVFPPPYQRLPKSVQFKYDGIPIRLSLKSEEFMTYYAKLLDENFARKTKFIKNFFKDWRSSMTKNESEQIKYFSLCDFTKVYEHFQKLAQKRKQLSNNEKSSLKRAIVKLQDKYGYCNWDGRKEKIYNFHVEPPGLFRGRGNHPKMGKLKKRIQPEDITINCSSGARVPVPPAGHRWKHVIHNPHVTWLASWMDSVSCIRKYIMLNPSSQVKSKKDFLKYETARKLKANISRIRQIYKKDLNSQDIMVRQRAVVLYFIDRLALRAGNEKSCADTVGCCSLRCKHVTLHRTAKRGKWIVNFNFLGKDSIPYQNTVAVPPQVFRNLLLFKTNKSGSDKLFDCLNTSHVNKYLQSLMEGLTAKVFRTYNASLMLQTMLKKYIKTSPNDLVSKLWAYNRANREVAILCNHQRSPPKRYNFQLKNVKEKIRKKLLEIDTLKKDKVKKVICKPGKKSKEKLRAALRKRHKYLLYQLLRLRLQASDTIDNKSIALGTSKMNYLDPRITVAWCLNNYVPIEKIYSKAQRDKFAWAIKAADRKFVF